MPHPGAWPFCTCAALLTAAATRWKPSAASVVGFAAQGSACSPQRTEAVPNEGQQGNTAGPIVLKHEASWRHDGTHVVMSPRQLMRYVAAPLPQPSLDSCMTASGQSTSSAVCPVWVDSSPPGQRGPVVRGLRARSISRRSAVPHIADTHGGTGRRSGCRLDGADPAYAQRRRPTPYAANRLYKGRSAPSPPIHPADYTHSHPISPCHWGT